eukprot:gene4413-4731_t
MNDHRDDDHAGVNSTNRVLSKRQYCHICGPPSDDHDRVCGCLCDHDRGRRARVCGCLCDHDRGRRARVCGRLCDHDRGRRARVCGRLCDHDRGRRARVCGCLCDHDRGRRARVCGRLCDHDRGRRARVCGRLCDHDRGRRARVFGTKSDSRSSNSSYPLLPTLFLRDCDCDYVHRDHVRCDCAHEGLAYEVECARRHLQVILQLQNKGKCSSN